jgi:hypothetical protein
MEYAAFIARVQQHMGVAGPAETERATHATLETLGEACADVKRGNWPRNSPKNSGRLSWRGPRSSFSL